MTKQELEAKIKKMERGLSNPNIEGDTKEALSKALENAKAQLSDLDAATDSSKTSKKSRHRNRKPIPRTTATTYNWNKAEDVEELEPIHIECRHYHIKAKKKMYVGLKHGASTRKSPVNVGDHIIFDDRGYPVYIMEDGAFARKCTKEVSKPKAEKTEKSSSKPKSKPKGKTESKTESKTKGKSTGVTQLSMNLNVPKSKNARINAIKKMDALLDKAIIKSGGKSDRNKALKYARELSNKKDYSYYRDYIVHQLKKAEKNGVKLTPTEIKKLALAIRPFIQSYQGTVQDIEWTNVTVLEPTYANLLRWTEQPEEYDMKGVDIKRSAKPTTTAKKPKQPKILGIFKW